jgi:hypothetical protein
MRVGIRAACILVIIIDMVARHCALILMVPVIGLAQEREFLTSTVHERVSAAAIIHELNLARQKPALYAGFVEQMRMSGSPGAGPGAPLSMRQYDSCAPSIPNPLSHSRPGFARQRPIIAEIRSAD